MLFSKIVALSVSKISTFLKAPKNYWAVVELSTLSHNTLYLVGRLYKRETSKDYRDYVASVNMLGKTNWALSLLQNIDDPKGTFIGLHAPLSEQVVTVKRQDFYSDIVSIKNGEFFWGTTLEHYIDQTTLNTNGDLLLSGYSRLMSIDRDTGTLKWSKVVSDTTQGKVSYINGLLIREDASLFIQNQNPDFRFSQTEASLVSPINGTILWKKHIDGIPIGSFSYENIITMLISKEQKAQIYQISENGKIISTSTLDLFAIEPSEGMSYTFSQKGDSNDIIFLTGYRITYHYPSVSDYYLGIYEYSASEKSINKITNLELSDDIFSIHNDLGAINFHATSTDVWIIFTGYEKSTTGIAILQIDLLAPDSCFINPINNSGEPIITNSAEYGESNLNIVFNTDKINPKNSLFSYDSLPLKLDTQNYCNFNDSHHQSDVAGILAAFFLVAILCTCGGAIFCCLFCLCKKICDCPKRSSNQLASDRDLNTAMRAQYKDHTSYIYETRKPTETKINDIEMNEPQNNSYWDTSTPPREKEYKTIEKEEFEPGKYLSHNLNSYDNTIQRRAEEARDWGEFRQNLNHSYKEQLANCEDPKMAKWLQKQIRYNELYIEEDERAEKERAIDEYMKETGLSYSEARKAIKKYMG